MQSLMLTAAALCALGSGVIAHRLLTEAAGSAAEATAMVLAARHAVALGAPLQASDMKWAPWPVSALDPGYILQTGAPHAAAAFAGAIARSGFLPGEPVTAAKIIARGEGGALSASLAPGMRAIAITAPDDALSGALAPGDRVDLIAARENAAVGAPDARTVLSGVKVLGAQAVSGGRAQGTRVITLEVTLEGAELAAAARGQGRLAFALAAAADAAAGRTAAPRPRLVKFGVMRQAGR